MQFKQHTNRRHEGFTMIEMLIALAIVGVLVAIAIPEYYRQRGVSYRTESYVFLRNVHSAQMAYFFEGDSFANKYSKLDLYDDLLAMKYYQAVFAPFCGISTDTICTYPSGQPNPQSYIAPIWGDIDNRMDGGMFDPFQEDLVIVGHGPDAPAALPTDQWGIPYVLSNDFSS